MKKKREDWAYWYCDGVISEYLEEKQYKDNKLPEYIQQKILQNDKIEDATKTIRKEIMSLINNEIEIMSLDFSIVNASANKAFEAKIINSDEIEINITDVKNLEKIDGLTFDQDKQLVVGTPSVDGDFTLEIEATLISDKYYEKRVKGKCKFSIIPDPKSLWKEIEPEKDIPYPKDHSDNDYLITPTDETIFYASKRGRSHAHYGTYRDDDGKILALESWSVIAVADGAGSCTLSRRGSKIAVDNVVNALETLLKQEAEALEEAFFSKNQDEIDKKINNTMISATYTAIKAIEAEAKETNNKLKDYSTTLLVAAHKKTSKGHLILTFWVGDGVLAIYNKNSSIELLGEPDSGEFAGQTRFLDLTNAYDLKRTRIKLVEDFTALVLMSDGVSDPFFQTDKDLKDIALWDKLYEEIEKIIQNEDKEKGSYELMKWLDFWSKGNHDDRTIALLLPSSKKDEFIEETKEKDKIIEKTKDKKEINKPDKDNEQSVKEIIAHQETQVEDVKKIKKEHQKSKSKKD